MSDITIRIIPGAYTQHEGTAEQLRAEGLLPGWLSPPTGSKLVQWQSAGMDHALFKLPKARGAAPGVVRYRLQSSPTATAGDCLAGAVAHQAGAAAGDLLARQTLAGADQRQQHAVATGDAAFQAMLRRMGRG